jgi:hypothetical protein
VTFHRVIGDDEVSLPMEFEETRYDGIIPYSRYSGTFEFMNPDPHIYYFLRAVDAHGNITTCPRHVPENLLELNASSLVINEFQASNDTTIADEFEEYDDWLELYNNADSTLNLGGWSLSDDPLDPAKWLLPDVEIDPFGFLLLWMDDDEEQGELHSTFNMNRDGEFIGLYHRNGEFFSPVDTFSFGYQETDRSLARIPDGGPDWVVADPTPGATNVPIAVRPLPAGIPAAHAFMKICPNPFNPSTMVTLSLPARMTAAIEIFNLLGQSVYREDLGSLAAGIHRHRFNGSSLPSGMYLVRTTAGQQYLTQKVLLLK